MSATMAACKTREAASGSAKSKHKSENNLQRGSDIILKRRVKTAAATASPSSSGSSQRLREQII